MNFSQQIHRLEEQLLQEVISGRNLFEAVPGLLEKLDFSDFKRNEVLSFFENELPRQYYRPHHFGKFNLTLKWNEHFSIQLYFMDDIPTEIHGHSFEGYFFYLEGRVLESIYERIAGREIFPGIIENGIKLVSERIFHPLQGRAIVPGPIHQVLRIDPQSTVLMIMKHGHKDSVDGMILPSGHVINGHYVSDKFLRLVNLMEVAPEMGEEIVKQLDPREMMIYCFRNGEIKAVKMEKTQALLVAELKKYVDVDQISQSFKQISLKQKKLQLIGSGE